jgi:hypothetical protein
MVFSGGSYEDVARWLRNFLKSHAKRVDARAEIMFESGDERHGRSYGVRVRLRDRVSGPLEFDYHEVAERKGNLAWCSATADRVEALVRDLGAADVTGAGAR